MVLDLLLHHVLNELRLEWAIALDCDCLKARSTVNMLFDMMAFIVSQEFVIILIFSMHRRMHWRVLWDGHAVDRNDNVRNWVCRRVFIVFFMVNVVEDVALFLLFIQVSYLELLPKGIFGRSCCHM